MKGKRYLLVCLAAILVMTAFSVTARQGKLPAGQKDKEELDVFIRFPTRMGNKPYPATHTGKVLGGTGCPATLYVLTKQSFIFLYLCL